MTYAEISGGTPFTFDSDPTNTLYEKIGTGHYRRGWGKINFVCLPINNWPLGQDESITVQEIPGV